MLAHLHTEHIRHLLRSTTIYQEHSPFFYIFWKQCLMLDLPYSIEQDLTRARKKFLNDRSLLNRLDYGAGSRLKRSPNSVRRLAKTSLSPNWLLRILYNVRHHYQLANCIELGTSLGLSSSALQLAMPMDNLVTIEGDPSTANLARSLHAELGLSNITVKEGQFSSLLPSALAALKSVDLAFIDGHHVGSATHDYFNTILPFMSTDGILIFDDIFWSEDMTKAFTDIRHHPLIKASVLYRGVGFLFLSNNWPSPIHLDWVDRCWKPWTYFASL